MALTDTAIRNAKPRQKPYKMGDSQGMYLEVAPSGGKVFRLKYRFGGIEKRLTIGAYPTFTLQSAREATIKAKRQLSEGLDPSAEKQRDKSSRIEAAGNSFEAVASEWYENQMKSGAWVESTSVNIKRRIEDYLVPFIGKLPVSDIRAPDILKAVKKVEGRGSLNEASRTLQACGRIMRYAVANGLAEYDPCPALRGALTPHQQKHMAAITDPKAVGEMLRAFDSFSGSYSVQIALNLSPMLFVRPVELRGMRWAEVDLNEALWSIPATRMKMREPHIVPLASQAVALLTELRKLTGHLEFVFPNGRDPNRMMSEAAINAALRRLGYDTKSEHTGHGFRAMARTILHEQLNYPPEVIEAQLAHKPAGALGAAYNRTKFISQRIKMMQQWADYLDSLKQGGKVVGIGSKRKGAG